MHGVVRTQFCEEGLFSLIEHINTSERNRNILEGYAKGKTFTELGILHGISYERVRQIVVDYIIHCHWFIKRLPGDFQKGKISNINSSILNRTNIIICDCDFLSFIIDKLDGKIITTKKLGKMVWEDCTQVCEDIEEIHATEKVGSFVSKMLHNRTDEQCVGFLTEGKFTVWIY